MSEWQPIETAPKDGTKFVGLPKRELGFGGDWYGPTVCWVIGPRRRWRDDELDWDVRCRAMNCSTECDLSDFTHWMPLPEPPVGFDRG